MSWARNYANNTGSKHPGSVMKLDCTRRHFAGPHHLKRSSAWTHKEKRRSLECRVHSPGPLITDNLFKFAELKVSLEGEVERKISSRDNWNMCSIIQSDKPHFHIVMTPRDHNPTSNPRANISNSAFGGDPVYLSDENSCPGFYSGTSQLSSRSFSRSLTEQPPSVRETCMREDGCGFDQKSWRLGCAIGGEEYVRLVNQIYLSIARLHSEQGQV